MTDYRALSFWHDTVPDDLTPREPLRRGETADVVIVGGGLTGLWAAWYLAARDPSLDVMVVERDIAGFGASGRNGGWCSALFPRSTASLERTHGRMGALAMRRAMVDTVEEVRRAVEEAGVDCDYARGGTISYARTAFQLDAARAEVEEAEEYGVDALELWNADRVGAAGARGGVYHPACARVHPSKLVRGLARALERRGVRIRERTAVTRFSPGIVETDRGRIRCDRILVATEGYGAGLPRVGRRILPLYSLMIATEPLDEAIWDELQLPHGRTFTDFRHLLVYGQRTADDRFAFGGRGARYHWGSAIRPEYDRDPAVFEHLVAALRRLFPQIGEPGITHRWGGPLGVPRDWHASVHWNRRTRVGWAGGYVGDGLSTTNLAGRTLADLVTGTDSDLTRLPWVGHRSPRWEPEPLRFLGANAGLVAMNLADLEESRTGSPSVAARVMGPLTGH